ncbi:MAG: pectate lyase [Prevotella sp.]|nr:pectate lyase [Prevotella sp.]
MKRYLHTLIALLCLCICQSLPAQKKPKKELYIPMDYSTCGYHASERTIPNVPVVAFVEWQEGDCSPIIQQAIDQVAKTKVKANGIRGAILLGEGTFQIDQPLRITASGIIIRGMGREKTTLVKHGVDRGALIYVEGTRAKEVPNSDTLYIINDKLTAGSMTFTVNAIPKDINVGDRIHIVRPSTRPWIESLRMEDFGGGLDYTGWKPTDIDITYDRTITTIDGNQVTIDAPITTTISQEFGGAYLIPHRPTGELTECGIENLTLESAINDWNPKDEDHCWDGIFMENVRNSWVRRVNFRHLAGSAVNLQKHTSRITVEDCIASEPTSEIGGWRRNVFLTRGQQTLFQRCVSRQGIHDFAAGYCAAGPNAFVQCEGEESLGFSGSIGSWAAGLLFDIVNIDGNDLRFANLEQFQFGTGWNTANSMFWQCTASTIECYSPDIDNRSSAHGCWGTLTGNGEWTSSNDHVSPRSLFYDQLEKRLSASTAYIDSLAHILPRPTNATSSPTMEQAMELAQESLTTPRLTLSAWIDAIPFLTDATLSPKNIRNIQKVQNIRSTQKTQKTRIIQNTWEIHPPHLPLPPGNQFNIPWWSGRVKDNFVERDAKPAITRFVPGREGTGWTDRLDSVVSFLKENHYSSLYHHYGLWYDLRRTDHERVRRADGDVWAPFYEQPFARSGQGIAWDGLSRYDLSKPNLWYWQRLNEFASKAAEHHIFLFNEHYFQHNILEAGAHWVDCPWRPVNNINDTNFPEPVPFDGDKRIFMAEQFYDEQNPTLRPLHKQYIRMCLDQLKDQPNVVHLLSAEYTGPLHFTRFWLETIAEWEAETGHHPLIALSCTKDAQDTILADPILNKVVDIIDIRYWHYNTEGLWAPQEGKNMSPRQWMRKMKVGKTGFQEVYRAVRECRDRYPDKAITYFSQQYPAYGWAVLMGGGAMSNIPIDLDNATPLQRQMLQDAYAMRPIDGEGCVALGDENIGYLVYTLSETVSIPIPTGKFDIYSVHPKTGNITPTHRNAKLQQAFQTTTSPDKIFYLRRK